MVGLTPTTGGTYNFDLVINSDVSGSAGSYNIGVSGAATARPSVTLSGAPDGYIGTTPFNVTSTFSEDVTGFTDTDVTVINGTANGVTGSGAVYTIAVTPDGGGDVSVAVPANAAFAASGAGNLASEVVTISNQSVTETQELIAGFMANRSALLISNQPNLRRIIFGAPRAGGFSFAAREGTLDFRLNSSSGEDVWYRLSGSQSTVNET